MSLTVVMSSGPHEQIGNHALLRCCLFAHAAQFLFHQDQKGVRTMHFRTFPVHLLCPYAPCKGETLADCRAKVLISVVCRKCGRTYVADLDTAITYQSKPQRHNAN